MPSYEMGTEKLHIGIPPHGNLNTSDYSLAFWGMLDTADSALHEQIHEVFLGQRIQPEALESQKGNITIPIFQGPVLFSAPSPSHAMPGVPLQGPNSNDQWVSDESPGFLTGEGTQTGYGYDPNTRRKQFKPMGSAMPQISTTSVTSCLPPSSKAQSGSFKRVFQAPQPMAYTSEPHVLRQFSGWTASYSSNKLKRVNNQINIPQSEHRCKMPKVESWQDLRIKRPTEQADHILRERQRRDDMTFKFLTLEALLPPGPKRDRSTIVDHSIEYVKDLQYRVKSLQQKRSEIKSMTAALSGMHLGGNLKQKALSAQIQNQATRFLPNREVVGSDVPVMKGSRRSKDTTSIHHLKSQEFSISDLPVKTCIEKVDVHLHLPYQIVIEMTCRPHPHIQSQILESLDRLGLEVSRCSITKLRCQINCVIVVQPRVETNSPVSGDDVMRALKCAIIVPENAW